MPCYQTLVEQNQHKNQTYNYKNSEKEQNNFCVRPPLSCLEETSDRNDLGSSNTVAIGLSWLFVKFSDILKSESLKSRI